MNITHYESNTKTINKPVNITALYFSRGATMKSFPKRMEFDGNQYTFLESGLRYLIRKGQQFIELFDMTDGVNNYRLKFDNHENSWTLVGVSESPRALA
jgi:hypothetical protein